MSDVGSAIQILVLSTALILLTVLGLRNDNDKDEDWFDQDGK